MSKYTSKVQKILKKYKNKMIIEWDFYSKHEHQVNWDNVCDVNLDACSTGLAWNGLNIQFVINLYFTAIGTDGKFQFL